MYCKKFLAPSAASVLAVLALSTTALAAGPKVTVRVEGSSRTLLPTTVVQPHAGSIIKGTTPAGACTATSGAGALDLATHGRWNGTYSSGLGIEVTQIVGETHTYSPGGSYWGIWVDNRLASFGVCGLHLHPGEQLLFAPYPAKGSVYPLVLSAPRTATAGRAFKVKVSYYRGQGPGKPVAGVRLDGALTNRAGVASVTAGHAGKLRLQASRKGYIRSATVTVTVKP